MSGFFISGPAQPNHLKSKQPVRQEQAKKDVKEQVDAELREAITGKKNTSLPLFEQVVSEEVAEARQERQRFLAEREATITKLEAESQEPNLELDAKIESFLTEKEAKEAEEAKAERQAQAKLEARKQQILEEFSDLRGPSIVLSAVLRKAGVPEAEIDTLVNQYEAKRGFIGLRPQPGT